MNIERRAKKEYAKYVALTNAGEMIRQHVEGGFAFEDRELHELYAKECEKLNNKLCKISQKHLDNHKKLGVEINTEEF